MSAVVAIGLAPSSNPGNKDENDSTLFFLSVDSNSGMTAAKFAREIVEIRCKDIWLSKIANRSGNSVSIPVELIYGDGYRTVVKRKGSSLKDTKSLTCGICIIPPNSNERVDGAAQILPDDELYPHLQRYATSGNTPTLYIRTGGPVFGGPKLEDRLSTLEVTTSNKTGPWVPEELDSERLSYPVSMMKGPRKRKKQSEGATSTDSAQKPDKPSKVEDSQPPAAAANGQHPSWEEVKFSPEELAALKRAFEEEEVEDEGETKSEKKTTPKKKPAKPTKVDSTPSKIKDESTPSKKKVKAAASKKEEEEEDGSKPEGKKSRKRKAETATEKPKRSKGSSKGADTPASTRKTRGKRKA